MHINSFLETENALIRLARLGSSSMSIYGLAKKAEEKTYYLHGIRELILIQLLIIAGGKKLTLLPWKRNGAT